MLKVVSFHHIIRFEYPGHPAELYCKFLHNFGLNTYICTFAFGHSIIMSLVDFSLNRIQKVHTALTM